MFDRLTRALTKLRGVPTRAGLDILTLKQAAGWRNLKVVSTATVSLGLISDFLTPLVNVAGWALFLFAIFMVIGAAGYWACNRYPRHLSRRKYWARTSLVGASGVVVFAFITGAGAVAVRWCPTGLAACTFKPADALQGGGSLMVMELLWPADPVQAEGLLARIRSEQGGDEDLDVALACVEEVHARARRELRWCGPLDFNPGNSMRDATGQLKLIDLFYMQGLELYSRVESAPSEVLETFPPERRRYMFEIPHLLREAPPGRAQEMREALAAAERELQKKRRRDPPGDRWL